MPFSSFGLSEALVKTLTELKYERPYPVQEKVIPAIQTQKDVLVIAPTGSGKTLSFALPILNKLADKKLERNRNIQALIVLPTRELAIQVQAVFHTFTSAMNSDVRSMAVYGGVSINPQMKAMMGVNVLIATPGRLIDLIQRKAINIRETKYLVLVEADEMVSI